MKRRSFMKGIATAVAVAVSPVLLNKTALALAGDRSWVAIDPAKGDCIGTVTIWKVSEDGTKELVGCRQHPIVDNGEDFLHLNPPSLSPQPENKTIKMSQPGNIREIGVGDIDGGFQKMKFESSMTLNSEEYLEVEYDYRLS